MKERLTSALEKLYHFTISDERIDKYWPEMISVFNDEVLTASLVPMLYIYNKSDHRLRTIDLKKQASHFTLHDAKWTPDGNILYSATGEVGLLRPSGECITSSKQESPSLISISPNGIIHLADKNNGVFQSKDNGRFWSHVFKPNNTRTYNQVINIFLGSKQHFWILEFTNPDVYELHVYIASASHFGDNVTWTEISSPLASKTQVQFTYYSRLDYDGDRNIFMCDQSYEAVYLFSSEGQYRGQLLSSSEITLPRSIFVCKNDDLLYLSLNQQEINYPIYVFKIIYNESNTVI